MTLKRIYHLSLYLLLLGLVSNSACVGGRRWPEGKALYTGAKLKIKKQGNKASVSELKTQAREIIVSPKPNRRFLGFRAGVARYHLFPQGSWAQRRLAHKPVFFDAEQVKRTENALLNAAKHQGWLDAHVTSRVKWDRKQLRGKVKYRIELAGNPYRVVGFALPSAEHQLTEYLRKQVWDKLLPKNGEVYQLQKWIAFRQQLVKQARNDGFYYLSPEHLLFEVDTVRAEKKLSFRLNIKPDVPANALEPWQIGEVHLYPNYQAHLGDASEVNFSLDGMIVHRQAGEVLRNQILQRAVSFRPGDQYSEILHANTVAQLHSLRVFSNIQIKFEPMQEAGKLRCRIYLTPYLPQTVEVAASGVTANNLYHGAEVGARYINRNMARRGEIFQLRPAYSYLFLRGEDAGSRLNTFDLQAGLQRPYFLKNKIRTVQTPVYLLTTDLAYQNALYVLPRDESGEQLKFGFNELKAEAGFTRRPVRNTYWTQEVRPIAGSMQFVRLHPRALNELIDDLILADTSFLTLATQLSYAPRIVLAYDSRFRDHTSSTHFFRQMFRFRYGGYLLSDQVSAAVGNTNLIQFTTETDTRIYQKLRRRLTLAGRLVANFALPLAGSNPQGFPISDLYSAGGSNGLRSFALRSLGPGTWSDQTDTSAFGIVRRNGNMLLQVNSELRYRRKNLETALFVDLGNTWNTYASDNFQGGQFRLKQFHRELGLGSGLGLRYFYSLLVFRLDMGYALHNPSEPLGQRWASDFGLYRLRFAFAFGQAF